MGDDAQQDDHDRRADRQGERHTDQRGAHHPHPGRRDDHHPHTDHPSPTDRGLPRRRLLGAAAGAAAVTVGLTAGCDSSKDGPAARASRSADADRDAVAAERERAGDPDWRIRSLGPAGAVLAYADRTSIRPGEEVGLHVSTTAPGFRVSAYRVGWYRGAQARLVWRSGRVRGERQRGPRLVHPTRTVRADWRRSTAIPTDDWPPGAYLLRLDADHGHQRYVPLVVRSAGAQGATVLMHAASTWQAYNRWGGYSLYLGQDGSYDQRSLAVSFDRPYDKMGAEKFLVYERAVVVLAERLGIPLAYTTGIDVHLDPSALDGARAAISLGHDEYWTPEQRAHVTRARDAGTNIAFLGANTCFRRVRLEDGPAGGPRTVVCYKTSYAQDPRHAQHHEPPTHDFREPPDADPESAMTGVFYEGYPTDAPYVVHSPDHWVFEGTGVKRGDRFPHLVGVEYDRVTPEAPTPEPLEIIAHSPLRCQGRASHSDSSYYTASSGAGVFSSGTMRWVEGLMAGTRDDGGDHGMDARTGAFVTRATENVLRAFASGPAARSRPAPRHNVRSVYPT